MALIRCKECGRDVSTKAEACPNCGAVLKKKAKPVGCLGCLGIGFLVLFVLGIAVQLADTGAGNTSASAGIGARPTASSRSGASTASGSRSETQPAGHKEGDTVHVGYTSYAVWRSWWSNRLSNNQYINDPPNAMYLFLEMTVRNDDKKARMIPPFKLVDQDGREYEVDSRGYMVDSAIGILESLNPDVSKRGIVVFDVPGGRQYRLKVSGGYWSGEDSFIQLQPK